MGNLEKTDRQSVHCEYSPALTCVSAAGLDHCHCCPYILMTLALCLFVLLNGSCFLIVMAALT